MDSPTAMQLGGFLKFSKLIIAKVTSKNFVQANQFWTGESSKLMAKGFLVLNPWPGVRKINSAASQQIHSKNGFERLWIWENLYLRRSAKKYWQIILNIVQLNLDSCRHIIAPADTSWRQQYYGSCSHMLAPVATYFLEPVLDPLGGKDWRNLLYMVVDLSCHPQMCQNPEKN